FNRPPALQKPPPYHQLDPPQPSPSPPPLTNDVCTSSPSFMSRFCLGGAPKIERSPSFDISTTQN
ncbi:hypothetical protein TrRE_jg2780, partial [Triparma retinervis]